MLVGKKNELAKAVSDGVMGLDNLYRPVDSEKLTEISGTARAAAGLVRDLLWFYATAPIELALAVRWAEYTQRAQALAESAAKTGTQAKWGASVRERSREFADYLDRGPSPTAGGALAHRVRGAGVFDDLAAQAARNTNSNKVVIGQWLQDGKSYTKVAAHYRATYLKLENWRELSRTLTTDEVWEINKAFLRQQLKQGKTLILSHDPAKATGFFLREVEYLESLGFRFVQDGWVWRAIR